MILRLTDGTEVELDGQFGTASRKLAQMSGHYDNDKKVNGLTELRTEKGQKIVIAPPGSVWATLTTIEG